MELIPKSLICLLTQINKLMMGQIAPLEKEENAEDDFKSIEDCFNAFNDSFQGALSESFQLFADYAMKLVEIQHNIHRVTEDVSVEHQHLMNKKRGALDFVESFK